MKKTDAGKSILLFITAVLITLNGCNLETADVKTDTEEEPKTITSELVKAPAPEIILSSGIAVQGEYIAIYIKNVNLSDSDFLDPFGNKINFFEYTDGIAAFIPVDSAQAPGSYEFNFLFDGHEYKEKFTVLSGNYEKQNLEISTEMASELLKNKSASEEFKKEAEPLIGTYSDAKLWDEEFILPLKDTYKVTTTFGSLRTFSTGDFEYHNAIDYATKGGNKIYATNSGKVIFAQSLKLTGNTVIIDHGMGFVSVYYHLRKIKTEVGAEIKKDDVIGTVGTTGLSTGNHLHFGIGINGVFVNPDIIVGADPFSALDFKGNIQ